MADSPWDRNPAAPPRHTTLVRVTHWITALCSFALLLSGIQILISHPRFYWGETGNVNTEPLFQFPIPASRASVPTGYGYVLPDQNGWSRALHFQSAWAVVLVGALYVCSGLLRSHFQRNLLPASEDLSWNALAASLKAHIRFARPAAAEALSYNVLQKLAYLAVVFLLFPLAIWTGLAMSPAFVSVCPVAVEGLGGQQSARTIHFFVSVLLVLFLVVHISMVILSGFKQRLLAMITGRSATTGGNP